MRLAKIISSAILDQVDFRQQQSGRNQNQKPGRLAAAYHVVNNSGIKVFGRLWLNQYVGPVYPGIIAHKRNVSFAGLLLGHGLDLYRCVKNGQNERDFFKHSGLLDLARENGGMCTFWLGPISALYVASHQVNILDGTYMEPISQRVEKFMGKNFAPVMQNGDFHKKNRGVFEEYSKSKFLKQNIKEIKEQCRIFLDSKVGESSSLVSFCNTLVQNADSYIPGLFDLTCKALDAYQGPVKHVLDEFLLLVFKVLVHGEKSLGKEEALLVNNTAPAMREILSDNLESIAAAPKTNLFKRMMALNQVQFPESRKDVDQLDDDLLKAMFSGLTAAYDTTVASLQWVMTYVESNSEIKDAVIRESQCDLNRDKGMSYIQKVILEAMRIQPPVDVIPSIVSTSYEISYNGSRIQLPKGMVVFGDVYHSMRDPNVYLDPDRFSVANIEKVMIKPDELITTFLSLNRKEISGFSHPAVSKDAKSTNRKCPARFFSIELQEILLREIYGNYDVKISDLATEKAIGLNPSRPASGMVQITCRK